MVENRYSLFWNSHKNNVCGGLCSLQQKEEFVDMTIAADGHFVKVHQVVIALASPYLRDILSSMNTNHPVIYLNNISHKVLSSILEYIYAGEVVIPLEDINEVVAAGKNLCIKGIENVKLQRSECPPSNVNVSESNDFNDHEDFSIVSITQEKYTDCNTTVNNSTRSVPEEMELEYSKQEADEVNSDIQQKHEIVEQATHIKTKNQNTCLLSKDDIKKDNLVRQYTISNQGSLQMILNRYIYYLKHTNKTGIRQWRCVDYCNIRKCPAVVTTKDDIVITRCKPHNHGLHDSRIFKKVKSGNIYAEVKTAASNCEQIKKSAQSKSVLQGKVMKTPKL